MLCSCRRRAFPSAPLHALSLTYTLILLSVATCNDSPFPSTVPCLTTEQNFALFDGRSRDGHGQCRVGCNTFSNHHISITQKPTSCSIWLHPDVAVFRNPLNNNTCIPRGICIKQCGEEKPGCVYSGACTSQTCFKSIATGDPANLTRITYKGPRSYVSTNLGSTERDLLQPRVLNGEDWCKTFNNRPNGENLIVTRVATECDPVKPFIDNRVKGDNKRQCRSICSKFSDERIEIVRIYQSCDYCKKPAMDSVLNSSLPICISNKQCEQQCGPPSPGCVYTGTCRVQYCLSGIDSKKAATINLGNDDSGNSISITVDNSGPPIGVDPPAYARLPLSIDYVPSPTISSSPAPSPSNAVKSPEPSMSTDSLSASPSSHSGEESTKEEEGEDESHDGRWAWLGPLLGLLGAAIIGFAGTVAAALIRNRAPLADQSTVDGVGVDF